MKTKKQIRHEYTKYLVWYLNNVDALKFEQADRLIEARARQKFVGLDK